MRQNRRILVVIALVTGLTAGCAATPPREAENICGIFDEYPGWYDDALKSERRWQTPIPVQIAIIRQESGFRHNVKPPRDWFLGFIPLPRSSSAYGYAQAQDPAWSDYRDATGRRWAQRSNIEDALDFVGWYNDVSHKRLGIPKTDAERLYLAYHEGHGGYSRGSYRGKSGLQSIAKRVDRNARIYTEQLKSCEDRFRCRRFWQIWPFCR